MILEVWELIGCVVGVPKMAHTSISIHLGFRHLWNGKRNVNARNETFFQK